MTRTPLTLALLLAGGAAATLAAPARAQSGTSPAAPAAASVPAPAMAEVTAVAELKNAQGQKLGDATLRETPGGVLIEVKLSKVPAGAHAFHIHDAGKCEGPAFTTAGGHFNPDGKKHGLMAAAGAHAGDLPNVHVPESGTLAFEFLAAGVNLKAGDARSAFDANGAALVLHAKADDYKTDPAGAAGDRLACGVIEKRK
jgi:superoxide dismutase, Cu-Zn family